MDNSITMTTTDKPWALGSVTQVDASGNPLPSPDPSYGDPTFEVADPTIIQLNGGGVVPISIQQLGKTGSTTVTTTETSSVSGDPVLTCVTTVNVTGPVPASLDTIWTPPTP